MKIKKVLTDDFISKYENLPEPDNLPENFISKFKIKENGEKEKWYELCRRAIEGLYTRQQEYAIEGQNEEITGEWNLEKGKREAESHYDRMFNLEYTPAWWKI